MSYALQAKTDVVNELKNRLYYNQQEIQRLLNSSTTSHKETVDKVVKLLGNNVVAIESINLIESYFTPPAASIPEQSVVPQTEEELGVKKVD